ncbi:NAC domain-containing protein [Artemisia annua]|uniref:NAC domain-containing protein n=1 Tax=Artemisia annua TaxID=35608 RepID=A0A2U1PJY9_ARTAN|nr:NAC domain-containing protein [Artemisia annua]
MAYNNQEQHDYADSLEPGYRFCPTDVELIVNYLKPKIDTGRRHPNCRYYEVNIYDYDPDELTAKPEYRSCENKWYFLTSRERKHPNGTRSNRKTKSGSTWKASGKGKPQYDDMNRVVGSKKCLFHLDEKGNKTDWLMHEYTTDNPNIPIGSQEQKEDINKLTQWVLCKIYKKQKKRANNNVGDQEEAFEEQNQQLQDEPLPRRRRLSLNQECNQSNGPEHAQETNYHSNQQSDLNMVYVGASQTFPTTSMSTSPNSVTLQPMAMYCGSKLTQPAVQDPQAFAMDQVQQSVGNSTSVYYQNQPMPTSTNGFQFSCGASCSSSKGSPPAIVEQGDNDMAPGPHEEDIYDDLALLDYLLTFPAPSLAVQMDTSSNPMTVQQMASSQTLRDEVLQQQVQNSYDDTPSLFNQSMIVHENDDSYIDKLISEDAMGYYPSEDHSSDFLDELDDL